MKLQKNIFLVGLSQLFTPANKLNPAIKFQHSFDKEMVKKNVKIVKLYSPYELFSVYVQHELIHYLSNLIYLLLH